MEGFHNGVSVFAPAHLTGDMDIGLVGIERRAELIMLDTQYIGTGAGNELEDIRETAGAVKERNGYLESAVTCDKTALDYTLDKADVDVAAGHYAHDALASYVEPVV